MEQGGGAAARPRLSIRDLRVLLRAAEYGLDRLSGEIVQRALRDEPTESLERLVDAIEAAIERAEQALERS